VTSYGVAGEEPVGRGQHRGGERIGERRVLVLDDLRLLAVRIRQAALPPDERHVLHVGELVRVVPARVVEGEDQLERRHQQGQ
jgi:hypothetical protein